jgi:hypothetical protein
MRRRKMGGDGLKWARIYKKRLTSRLEREDAANHNRRNGYVSGGPSIGHGETQASGARQICRAISVSGTGSIGAHAS